MKSLCYCPPLNGCLWGKQVPFSSGRHTDTKGTHFLWLFIFAYTLPLSSLFAGLYFLPSGQGIHAHSVAGVRWQSLVPEKDTKASLSLSLSLFLSLLSLRVILSRSLHSSSSFSRIKGATVKQHFHHFNLTVHRKRHKQWPCHCVTGTLMDWHVGAICLAQWGH